MPADREALVAAIAADPADDTPRLVYADWLDEHGEPDRAEFVRIQCEAARSDLPRTWSRRDTPPERVEWDRRARELFDAGWPRWFAPFFAALGVGPSDWPDRYKLFWAMSRASEEAVLGDRSEEEFRARGPLPVGRLFVARGFGSWLLVDTPDWRPGGSLAEAFRHEPLTDITFYLGNAGHWDRVAGPALRRLRKLGLRLSSREDAAGGLFDDPHLTGVRELEIGSPVRRIDPAVLRRFLTSPLAARLRRVTFTLLIDGFATLADAPPDLPWEAVTFRIPGWRLPETVFGPLVALPFRGNVRELNLAKSQVADAGAAALAAADGWDRLERLDLTSAELGDAGLRALAAAPFARRLTHLRLGGSENRMTDDGVRAVAAALDPGRVRELTVWPYRLSAETLAVLRERFGTHFVEN